MVKPVHFWWVLHQTTIQLNVDGFCMTPTFWHILLITPPLPSLQKNKLLNFFHHSLRKTTMSYSCINWSSSLAATDKAPLLHLLKVLYEITNTHAQRLHGQPLTNPTCMLLTPMIVISIYLAFNQTKSLINLQKHMLLPSQLNNNPSLIQISLL